MSELEKAARMALEALERSETTVPYEGFGMAHREAERKHQAAITALRQALEQPAQQEPDDDDRVMTVVYRNVQKEDAQSFMDHPKAVWFGWCHAPYQRDDARYKLEKAVAAKQPLTDAQIGAVAADIWGSVLIAPQSYQAFARAIEQAHGIKGDA